MKKSIALIMAFMVILTCFAGCKSFEGGTVVTQFNGEAVAVVTEANGGVKRNDAGNIVVLVTDEDGNNIKEKGEIVTKAVAIEHAIIIGNRIEMADYAVNIPKGWTDSKSYSDLIITKEGTTDILKISSDRNAKLKETEAGISEYLNSDMLSSARKTNKAIKIAGEEANFQSAYITVGGAEVYMAFVTFSHNGVVYNCNINANHDLSGEIDEYIDILNTIEFVN